MDRTGVWTRWRGIRMQLPSGSDVKGVEVVLMAHPAVLRNLIEEYETLSALRAETASTPEVRQRWEDLSYTLCVATGTREVDSAVAAARQQLTQSMSESDEAALTA
ncbi:DUF5133 domain-containing protein [Streptomyces sp. NPDC015346]|uniref:DUF5133 domain-containing protein n=1 Tax=Streptomyces sp. NPDC015346 TaxID=3364954 RepID=UPI00370333BA